MKNQIQLILKDGSTSFLELEILMVQQDYFVFNNNQNPCVLVLQHHQQHSRLDLSSLKRQLLISFDQQAEMVGVTYCNSENLGPYILHNKQRLFLLIEQGILEVPMKIKKICI